MSHEVTCKGSFAFGTACGLCSRCLKELHENNVTSILATPMKVGRQEGTAEIEEAMKLVMEAMNSTRLSILSAEKLVNRYKEELGIKDKVIAELTRQRDQAFDDLAIAEQMNDNLNREVLKLNRRLYPLS